MIIKTTESEQLKWKQRVSNLVGALDNLGKIAVRYGVTQHLDNDLEHLKGFRLEITTGIKCLSHLGIEIDDALAKKLLSGTIPDVRGALARFGQYGFINAETTGEFRHEVGREASIVSDTLHLFERDTERAATQQEWTR